MSSFPAPSGSCVTEGCQAGGSGNSCVYCGAQAVIPAPRTNQGVLVLVPGSDYKAYCNVCGWKATTNARSIPEAQELCRAHAAKEHGR